MRKFTAALAVPVVAPIRVASLVYRGVGSKVRITIASTTMAVVTVLAPSAPSGTTAVPPTVILPVTSAAARTDLRVGLALDATVDLTFTTPMNPVSVARSVRVVPATSVDLSWDASRTVLSIAPTATWQPGTLHTVTVDAGTLAETGAPMSSSVRAAFLTRGATTASIAPTRMSGRNAAPDSAFAVTFNDAVDPATVADALRFEPAATVSVVRVGRRGVVRYVFTPTSPLAPNATYRLSLAPTVRDQEGGSIVPATLTVRTADAPTVVRFRPRDESRGVARDADVSVRFSERMDRASTKAAITVTADGRRVAGSIRFADDDTVVVFRPASPFRFGQHVVMTVAGTASSAKGSELAITATGRFTTRTSTKASASRAATPIPVGGSVGGGTWAAVEEYYLKLMNCTRTGGWVTSTGNCSSPGGRNVAALRIDQGISSKVSRPYAKLLATRGICNHFIGGNPGDRLRRAGYSSYIWAENLGCRSGSPYKAVLGSHLFFQAERPYLGGHYVNLMNAKYDRAGIGVWVAGGRVRLVVDFYHPR